MTDETGETGETGVNDKTGITYDTPVDSPDGEPIGGTAGWRFAARLARREVRRRPGRTALVASLIAVPVAGMLVGVAVLRTNEVSDAELWPSEYGTADTVLSPDTSRSPTALPEGSREVTFTDVWRVVGTEDGTLCRCSLSNMPFVPLTDGIVDVRSGRPPEEPGEVLLTSQAADELGAGIGERIELTQPITGEFTVVGLGVQRSWTDRALLVVSPDTELPAHMAAEGARHLVDLPDDMTPTEIESFEDAAGAHMMSPAYPQGQSQLVAGDDSNASVRWTWVAGGVGLVVLGIVIAAAFAASARRQLATLGQLAANGATPVLLRRVLFLQGTVTGLIGSAAGLALGGAVLVGLRGRLSELVDRAAPGWDVRLLDVLPIVVLAVVAATVAALVPAFGASRVSVLTALAGRRPLGQVSRRQTAAGLALAATGLGMLAAVASTTRGSTEPNGEIVALAAVAGPVLLLFGVCAAAPAYVAVLRPVAGRLPGVWRLAARSLARQRTRTSAMVSAICAISAVAVAVAAVGLGGVAESRSVQRLDRLPDDVVRVQVSPDPGLTIPVFPLLPPTDVLDEAADRAAAALPEAGRHDIRQAVAPDRLTGPMLSPLAFVPSHDGDAEVSSDGLMPQQATIVDDGFRAAYDLDADVERGLDETGAVWVGPAPGRVTIEVTTALPPEDADRATTTTGGVPSTTVSFEAAVVGPDDGHGFGSTGELLLTPAKTEDLGLVTAPAEVVLRTPAPLTAAQRTTVDDLWLAADAARERDADAAGIIGGAGDSVWYAIEYPETDVGDGVIETAPTAVALLFALLVLAVGLALAAVETRDERDVLAVLGAPPRTLRRTSGCKAFLLTMLAGAVAIPVGLLPVAVYTRLDDDPLSLVVPWRTIGLLLVAVPLVAALLTSTATRTALRFRPLRVSTATFD